MSVPLLVPIYVCLSHFLSYIDDTDPCARFRNARAASSNSRSLPNIELLAEQSLASAGIPPAFMKASLVSAEQTMWETAAQAWMYMATQMYSC
jgi:hypothetical protein